MVIPLTTPKANVSAKIFIQNWYASIQNDFPVATNLVLKNSKNHPIAKLMVGNKI
jgi:hypothetical protein